MAPSLPNGIFKLTDDEYATVMYELVTKPARTHQLKERERFESKLLDVIKAYWKPGPEKESAAIALVDFSDEGRVVVSLYKKASGCKTDIVVSNSTQELRKSQFLWAKVVVNEVGDTNEKHFELITDPNHSYTVYSKNLIDEFTIPVRIDSLSNIKFLYQDHPYIT